MAQIGLLADFKRKFLQWDGVIVPKKETSGMLGQIYLVTAETYSKFNQWLTSGYTTVGVTPLIYFNLDNIQ